MSSFTFLSPPGPESPGSQGQSPSCWAAETPGGLRTCHRIFSHSWDPQPSHLCCSSSRACSCSSIFFWIIIRLKISKSSAAQTWGQGPGQITKKKENPHLLEEAVLERPFRTLPASIFKLFWGYSDVLHVTSEHKIHLKKELELTGVQSVNIWICKKTYEGQSWRKLVHKL